MKTLTLAPDDADVFETLYLCVNITAARLSPSQRVRLGVLQDRLEAVSAPDPQRIMIASTDVVMHRLDRRGGAVEMDDSDTELLITVIEQANLAPYYIRREHATCARLRALPAVTAADIRADNRGGA